MYHKSVKIHLICTCFHCSFGLSNKFNPEFPQGLAAKVCPLTNVEFTLIVQNKDALDNPCSTRPSSIVPEPHTKSWCPYITRRLFPVSMPFLYPTSSLPTKVGQLPEFRHTRQTVVSLSALDNSIVCRMRPPTGV